ncbi:LysR family transcriptional regulator [Oscillospiraceae bacterium LTW-04]|nr:LysR family transcriptional regulator [Oscillospiraceae bacterium MB24-C1]
MQTNYEVFVIVAEEMSISKAALHFSVTEQCISDHIKRIEKQFGLQFFTRKPRFQLTEAGKSMLQSLQQMQAVESMMLKNMEQRTKGEKGSFVVGINSSRAQVLLPQILPEYYEKFPEVKISFLMDDTVILEQRLLEAKIDLFFGINTQYHENFSYQLLRNENIGFIVSEGLLRKHFNEAEYTNILLHPNLKYFTHLPFLGSYKTGAINFLLQSYLKANHMELYNTYDISDVETQLSLCSKGLFAMFCPQMLLSKVNRHNAHCEKKEYIHVLNLEAFRNKLRLDLVSLQHAEKPYYLKEFEKKIQEVVRKLYINN